MCSGWSQSFSDSPAGLSLDFARINWKTQISVIFWSVDPQNSLNSIHRDQPRSNDFSSISRGHLKPVTLKPFSCIFAFSAFSCPHFLHFPRFRFPQTLVFLGRKGPSAFSAYSPYRVRIADFENPTDRLYYDRP